MNTHFLKYFFTEDADVKDLDLKLWLSFLLEKGVYNDFMIEISKALENPLYDRETFKLKSSRYLFVLCQGLFASERMRDDFRDEWICRYISSRKNLIRKQWYSFIEECRPFIVDIKELKNGFLVYTNFILNYSEWYKFITKHNLNHLVKIAYCHTQQRTRSTSYCISLLLC